ncbi:N-acetylglutaminylglutamine synthetase [Fodinicurvata sp. EGI_FJ10296]|uniref:N-acetylglutaminylglutamine synthetase n=1 Tax=Fodinicurvata sp. EGI_FJ10296 TaxID=3231908 RepID=UPI003453698B
MSSSRQSRSTPPASHRLEKMAVGTVVGQGNLSRPERGTGARPNAVLDCGWGRLVFAHTFADNKAVAETLSREREGHRDIGFYVREPHVVLSFAPLELFLDPSHTYRLWMSEYRPARRRSKGFYIRPVSTREEIESINRIYAHHGMMTVDPTFLWNNRRSRKLCYLVAIDENTEDVLGVVMGADHRYAFDDPENGSSLWSLAVDPQARHPGIGEALVRRLAERYKARGRTFLDLSVMHNNVEAQALYEKLGFRRIPAFTVKKRNMINERLYTGPEIEETFNPYAQIIIDEARRRGVAVEPIDPAEGYFRLSLGGRAVICREALTELTTAIAMSRCDNKAVTRRLCAEAGLRVPAQTVAGQSESNIRFLENYGSVVVKPARGEQGMGISVDIRSPDDLEAAIETAKAFSDKVLLEQYCEGDDLRIIVIGREMVAAAIRKPATIFGNGNDPIRTLIERQSRRRAKATSGESTVPMDQETERCIELAGYSMESVLADGKELRVRKTANLHTGGTIHDVTDRIHPTLAEAALRAAEAIDIPVVGMDLMVPDVEKDDYVIIEANERPGLANHEPQPTAQKFVDLLFPQTVVRPADIAARRQERDPYSP